MFPVNRKKNISGIKGWIFLRITSFVLLVYFSYVLIFFLKKEIDHILLKEFFSKKLTKVLTIFSIISIVFHSYIGIKNILTDYFKSKKIRVLIYFIMCIILFFYLFYIISILCLS
ncbi:succinate dehydrogenase, hydrophobic membrane anchor protein [Candidatus Riesia pediculischaeffi]|uniref:succinate dehydrogenase, hydrophobic membrane anchor protein n=1 Tax=Candidatus Riesia pediculischaeffi TaxID=428411 RepID=UPI003B96893B